MDFDPKFRPVGWVEQRDPWTDPQFLDSSPHNLPPNSQLLRRDPNAPNGFRDPHHYAKIISQRYAVPDETAGAASILILNESNLLRNFLSLRNSSAAATVYVSFGQAASSTYSPIILTAGQTVLFDTVVPQDDVWVIAGAASGFIVFGYSNITE